MWALSYCNSPPSLAPLSTFNPTIKESPRVRYFYSFLLYLAMPFIFLKLWWRSRRLPAYKERWSERLGVYPFKLDQCIWVHTVSMGETIAAAPLIKNLIARYSAIPVLVTTMTPTGSEQVKKLFGDTVKHVYLPYDMPDAVTRFLDTMHPQVGVIMETEMWPNLLAACKQKQIPVCLVNARLSEKSAHGYGRIASITKEMLENISVIAAHGEKDAERFIQLGAAKEKVVVTGNIKFDLTLPDDLQAKSDVLREALGKDRFVWIAASTHEGEEEIILAAHKALRTKNPQALLILVPRHPDRFNAIASLSEQTFQTARRSSKQACLPETAVYLGDTMGELMVMYGAADVAFVGGSLIPRGGHNMLEPGALGKPILTGPHLFNFKEISELFVVANAMTLVKDADSLARELELLAGDVSKRSQVGERAKAVVSENRGALEKQLGVISRMMGA
jgi:3-deoxy-D-manno-octulosonic-acid transferase